jgi:hypothetical protein
VVTTARGVYGYRLRRNHTACALPDFGAGPSAGADGRVACAPPVPTEAECEARGCCFLAAPAAGGALARCVQPRPGDYEEGQGLTVASAGEGRLLASAAPGGGAAAETAETDQGEAEAHAAAAARLLLQPTIWAAESAAALRRAREHFAPAAVAADLEALLGVLGLPPNGAAAATVLPAR